MASEDPSSQLQAVKDNAKRVSCSLGKPSRKQHVKILELLILFVSWASFAVALIVTTPRLNVAWKLRLTRQLQVIGLMLNIMSHCLSILAPRLWIMVETSRSRPKLQNLDAILRNSIMTSNTHWAWRILLLVFGTIPIALGLAYKDFIGGSSTQKITNRKIGYSLTAAPGLVSNGTLKFGPSYMANATLPFIMAWPDSTIPFPQTYGFNNLVISNTSSAFIDIPSPDQVLSLQQSLQKDITSSFTVSANVQATVTTYDHSIEDRRDDDTFWDYYLNQRGRNSTPDSFSSVINTADLCSGKHLGMLTGDKGVDASWMFLSFVQSSDLSQSSDIWIPTFRSNAFLFNTRREICDAKWQITYNAMHLVEAHCSVSSLLPRQDLLVTPNLVFRDYDFQFGDYYMPSLVEYLAPLSPPVWDSTEEVYQWTGAALMPIFATTVAAMYWSRITVLFGPDSYDNKDYTIVPPPWDDAVSYTSPETLLLSNRQTMHPSWALYFILAAQPILISLTLMASFVLSNDSVIDSSNFGIIAILAGVRTGTLKVFEGASFSGKLQKPITIRIVRATTASEKQPQIEYSFCNDSNPPRPSFIAKLRNRFIVRKDFGYYKLNEWPGFDRAVTKTKRISK